MQRILLGLLLAAFAMPAAWAQPYPFAPGEGVVPGETTPRSWQQAEIEKWGKVIRAKGAKPD